MLDHVVFFERFQRCCDMGKQRSPPELVDGEIGNGLPRREASGVGYDGQDDVGWAFLRPSHIRLEPVDIRWADSYQW